MVNSNSFIKFVILNLNNTSLKHYKAVRCKLHSIGEYLVLSMTTDYLNAGYKP